MYEQPGIINALDYGMSPSNSGAANATGLQDAINAAQAVGNTSAIVLIPSFGGTLSAPDYGSYEIDLSGGTIEIPQGANQQNSLLICGTGSGTTLEIVSNGNLFLVKESSSNSSFVAFQDITVRYAISGAGTGIGAAFQLDTQGNSLFRVNVTNCQQPIVIGNNGGFSSIRQCGITYDTSYPTTQACTGIQISDGAAQINIEQCTLSTAVTIPGSIGIKVNSSYYTRVTDSQISGFESGIYAFDTGSGGVVGATFSALSIDATGSCILIEPTVADVSFVNCTCEPTSGIVPSHSGIRVHLGSGHSSSEIDNVRFTSCIVAGYGAASGTIYGLEITGGQNIQVNGGSFSGNGTAGIAIVAAAAGAASEIQITGANCIGPSYAQGSPPVLQLYGIYIGGGQDIQIIGANCSGNGLSSSALGAGIYIVGSSTIPVQDVRIVGVNCSGTTLGGSSSVQQYGVYVNEASGITVDGCNLMANTAYGASLNSVTNITISASDVFSGSPGAVGVFVAGTSSNPADYVLIRNCNGSPWTQHTQFLQVSTNVENLEVTNCAGYNDTQALLVNAGTAPFGSFSGVTYGYYGPTAFYVASTSSGTLVHIDSYSTSLTQGGFTLGPSESAFITGPTTHFLMLGR